MHGIGVVVKNLDKKWTRRRWTTGEYIYFNKDRYMFVLVYPSGKERKWNPNSEDLIYDDWRQVP